jgi:serine O-acetyltransferase
MQTPNNDELGIDALLREDLLRQRRLIYGECGRPLSGLRFWVGLLAPRSIPVLLCRVAHLLCQRRFGPIAKIVSMINFIVFGIETSVRCRIRLGLFLPHTQGTVIGFLAISSGKGGLDGWRMMATDDTGTDLWTVAGAWEELEGFGGAV